MKTILWADFKMSISVPLTVFAKSSISNVGHIVMVLNTVVSIPSINRETVLSFDIRLHIQER